MFVCLFVEKQCAQITGTEKTVTRRVTVELVKKCVIREQVHVDQDVLTGGRVQLVTVSNVHTSYYMCIVICV